MRRWKGKGGEDKKKGGGRKREKEGVNIGYNYEHFSLCSL